MQSHTVVSAAALAALVSQLVTVAPAAALDLPAIKSSAANAVPACATPGRLQAYLQARNPALDARFQTIAVDYMREGEALGVRWDYAFFQMIMETGQLSFKNGSRQGDVKPSQNNFAGLGATGGVPGESFPDVATGVRAHLQHVLLYAGEKLDNPVAERTRKVQEWGVLTDWQKGLKKPITFADLAAKWAPKSKAYVESFEQIAEKFTSDHCKAADPNPEYVAAARGQTAPPLAAAPEKPAEKISGAVLARQAPAQGDGVKSGLGAAAGVKILNAPAFDEPPVAATPAATPEPPAAKLALPSAKTAPTKTAAVGALPKAIAPLPETPAAQPQMPPSAKPQSAPAAAPAVTAAKCRVWTASYGGQRAVIVKSVINSVANFTVLDVNEGQETREAEAFIAAYAKGGAVAGQFADQNKALEKAFELCPEG
jgi:Mannosyl-glycoprotein endo-beta-N-acetylglucosaminidase